MTEIDWFPLLLSLRVATIATLITAVIGVGGAYVLTRYAFPGRGLIEAIASLPIVLPPTVLGYYLLVSIGRNSPLGRGYEALFGRPLVFTWQAAVIAATIASLPYCLRTATAAIAAIDAGYEEAARVAGIHGPRLAFVVTLPMASRGIIAGISLAFARALGDFGTTIMVAGNIPGRTQTMPLAVYDRVQAFDYTTAGVLAAVLAIVAIIVLLLVRRLERTAL